MEAYIAAVDSGNLSSLCHVVEPSVQSACSSAVAGASPSGITYKNVKLGYIAIEGDRALVGITGTYCDPNGTTKCTTNADPSAILSSGRSFDSLYPEEVQAASNSASSSYSLAPCQRVDSAWYIYVPPNTFSGR